MGIIWFIQWVYFITLEWTDSHEICLTSERLTHDMQNLKAKQMLKSTLKVMAVVVVMVMVFVVVVLVVVTVVMVVVVVVMVVVVVVVMVFTVLIVVVVVVVMVVAVVVEVAAASLKLHLRHWHNIDVSPSRFYHFKDWGGRFHHCHVQGDVPHQGTSRGFLCRTQGQRVFWRSCHKYVQVCFSLSTSLIHLNNIFLFTSYTTFCPFCQFSFMCYLASV